MKKSTYILILAALATSLQAAQFKTSSMFSDGMVIQRDIPMKVFGTGDSGQTITVSFKNNKNTTQVDKTGKWLVELPKVALSSTPSTLTISSGSDLITINDVLVGDVWLCSGQSNMDRSVGSFKNSKQDIAAANFPEIRLFIIPNTPSTTPLNDVKGSWKKCSPNSVKAFSAVGYYYGRKLYQNLNIPIGLIESASGGTIIETWIPLDLQIEKDPTVVTKMEKIKNNPYNEAAANKKHEQLTAAWKVKKAKWTENGKKGRTPRKPFNKGNPRLHKNCPGNLYNGMIFPIVQFPIKGAIWYQGESNAGGANNYLLSLKLLSSSWRKMWNQGEFPIYIVQLPNFRRPWTTPAVKSNWAAMREVVLQASKKIPNVGFAVTIDLGEANDVHPQNKQDVGDRLGRVALHKTYGKNNFVWTGPIAKSCSFDAGKVTVKFENGGAPIAAKNGEKLYGFVLTDTEGTTVHADAMILDDNTVEVSSEKIKTATAIHYAWADNPVGSNLTNKEKLPASPFMFKK